MRNSPFPLKKRMISIKRLNFDKNTTILEVEN
jgi:hypothetical protein